MRYDATLWSVQRPRCSVRVGKGSSFVCEMFPIGPPHVIPCSPISLPFNSRQTEKSDPAAEIHALRRLVVLLAAQLNMTLEDVQTLAEAIVSRKSSGGSSSSTSSSLASERSPSLSASAQAFNIPGGTSSRDMSPVVPPTPAIKSSSSSISSEPNTPHLSSSIKMGDLLPSQYAEWPLFRTPSHPSTSSTSSTARRASGGGIEFGEPNALGNNETFLPPHLPPVSPHAAALQPGIGAANALERSDPNFGLAPPRHPSNQCSIPTDTGIVGAELTPEQITKFREGYRVPQLPPHRSSSTVTLLDLLSPLLSQTQNPFAVDSFPFAGPVSSSSSSVSPSGSGRNDRAPTRGGLDFAPSNLDLGIGRHNGERVPPINFATAETGTNEPDPASSSSDSAITGESAPTGTGHHAAAGLALPFLEDGIGGEGTTSVGQREQEKKDG